MPALKYQGTYENNIHSGFVVSPNTLQQGESLLRGLLIDWETPGDLILTYRIGFAANPFVNGALGPNTLLLSGTGDFINYIQVSVKNGGFFSWLIPGANLTITATTGTGMMVTAPNNGELRSDSGFKSFSIQFQ